MGFKDFPAGFVKGLPTWEAEDYLKKYLASEGDAREGMRKSEMYARAHYTVFYVFSSHTQRKIFFDGIVDKIIGEEHMPSYNQDTKMLINEKGDREVC